MQRHSNGNEQCGYEMTMTTSIDDSDREEVAHLIRKGYTSGRDPRWTIRYSFDHNAPDADSRIEEIADLIEEGHDNGPDWSLDRSE